MSGSMKCANCGTDCELGDLAFVPESSGHPWKTCIANLCKERDILRAQRDDALKRANEAEHQLATALHEAVAYKERMLTVSRQVSAARELIDAARALENHPGWDFDKDGSVPAFVQLARDRKNAAARAWDAIEQVKP